MSEAWLQDPDSLWHTTGLGREEFVQRLLSTSIMLVTAGTFRVLQVSVGGSI